MSRFWRSSYDVRAVGTPPCDSSTSARPAIVREIRDVSALEQALGLLEPRVIRRGAKHGFWTWVYYGLFDQSFLREQKAVLAGRLAYQASLKRPDGNMAILRRNVHRIEKGLLMRPRRVPFALDYIEETIDAYVVTAGRPVAHVTLGPP